MDASLKKDADALWDDLMSKAKFFERKALASRKGLFYELIDRYFGKVYSDQAAIKGKS